MKFYFKHLNRYYIHYDIIYASGRVVEKIYVKQRGIIYTNERGQ